MNFLSRSIILLVCASALMEPGRAATLAAAADDEIIVRIDSRMAQLDSLIFSAAAPEASPSALAGRVAVEPDTIYSQAVDAVVNARISTIKAATGVQLTGQTYYRADGALGIDDDDEAVSRYTGKIQAEARWYFLQSGLLKRKGRIAQERLAGDITRLQHERGRTDPDLYNRRERLQLTSDSMLASVMLHRVTNLRLLEDAYLYLLNNESITSDDLLRIIDDRAEAERRLATIATDAVLATSLSAVTASTVTIDTAAVIAGLADTDIELQLLSLQSQLIDQKASNETWWSDVRLAPFVRYSHYFRHNMPASSNVDVGMSFTVPINAEASRRRRAMLAEKNMLQCQHDNMLARNADRVRYLALEAERLNRAITAEWDRANALRRYLRMRRNAYDNRAGEFNRLSALKEYNSYLRCLENIIEIQYRRDCLLADIQAIVPAVPVLDHCIFTPLNN